MRNSVIHNNTLRAIFVLVDEIYLKLANNAYVSKRFAFTKAVVAPVDRSNFSSLAKGSFSYLNGLSAL